MVIIVLSDTGCPFTAARRRNIAWAKQMGYHMMLFYYTCMFRSGHGYLTCGNYDESDFWESYPGGYADLKAMLDKLKAAGITPGLHFLHTHIGLESRYVTPVADHRLNLTRHFTLAKPLSEDDTTIYVEQNPLGCVPHEHFQRKDRSVPAGGGFPHGQRSAY